MADIFTKEKRSSIMSRIRSKNSKAELMVFKELRKRGIYFQKHYNRAPGKPDIALPRRKIAIFIDGDFWHGRTIEQIRINRGNDPGDYWIMKITRNIERDRAQEKSLLENGWQYMRVWESDINRKSTRCRAIEDIVSFLKLGNSNYSPQSMSETETRKL